MGNRHMAGGLVFYFLFFIFVGWFWGTLVCAVVEK
jgi:uncharacterized membrane protein